MLFREQTIESEKVKKKKEKRKRKDCYIFKHPSFFTQSYHYFF